MSSEGGAPRSDQGKGASIVNQSLVGGLLLIALSVVALWTLRPLDQGTLGSMGPGLLPRALAVMLCLCGIALAFIGVTRHSARIEGFAARPAILVSLSILLFALTIRPVDLGFFRTPGLGMLVAGPLAVIVGGFATPEARLRELLVLALLLTPACMFLFGDLLNLSIPSYPDLLRDAFPPGTPHRTILRTSAAAMAAAGLLLLVVVVMLGRGKRSNG